MNIELKDYPFEGNEYWLNMFLSHGHTLVVFFLISKYQAETDQSKKTKIMMGGMLLVLCWLFGTPYLKTQRLALEYQGQRVYQSDTFELNQLSEKL